MASPVPTSRLSSFLSSVPQRPVAVHCLIVLIMLLATHLLRLAIQPHLRQEFPYITYFLAVVLAGFFLNWRASALAAFLTIALVQKYVLGGPGVLPRTASQWTSAGLFLFNASGVVALSALVTRARDRAVASADEARRSAERLRVEAVEHEKSRREVEALNARLRMMMAETHHRVKNNLQVVAALVEMEMMAHPETIATEELNRLLLHVRSLATMHDMLTAQARDHDGELEVDLAVVLGRMVPVISASAGGRVIRPDLDTLAVPIRQATAVAVVVNELVSNAVKHGGGEIDLTLKRSDGRARLIVRDHGPGFPADLDAHRQHGMGLEMAESLSRWDLNGDLSYGQAAGGGAEVVVEFPVAGPSVDSAGQRPQ